MGLELVSPGKNPPEEINVIIEIPKDSEPVKYEVDKETGAIFVDRIRPTCWWYCRCRWSRVRWCAAVRSAC
jgi:inorganic pyrophosphatase